MFAAKRLTAKSQECKGSGTVEKSGLSQPRCTSNVSIFKRTIRLRPLFTSGLTDGLPVVPPTEERVPRMLASVDRDPQQVLGTVGPNYGPASVEKVAINAVMAGCQSSYFPVVVAEVEALCEDQFAAHAINVTTFSATSLTIINGPIRHTIGVNCGHNALGHGFRANATIGRSLRLIILNIGGGPESTVEKALASVCWRVSTYRLRLQLMIRFMQSFLLQKASLFL